MAQSVYSKYLSKPETRQDSIFSSCQPVFRQCFLCLCVFMDKEIQELRLAFATKHSSWRWLASLHYWTERGCKHSTNLRVCTIYIWFFFLANFAVSLGDKFPREKGNTLYCWQKCLQLVILKTTDISKWISFAQL